MATAHAFASRSTGSVMFRKPRHLVLFAIAAAAANWIPATAGQADEGILTWIVQSISSADESDIVQASALQLPVPGSALVTGQQISTGANDTMVLVNGRDLVTIGPKSVITVGDNDAATPVGNLGLSSGTVRVEVGKRKTGQTFSVDAPYLVATVKGTTFNVSTSSELSTVSVTEGVVGVAATATGLSVDVTAGRTATVSRNASGAPALSATIGNSVIDIEGVAPPTDSTGTGTSTGTDSGTGISGTGGTAGAVGGAVDGAAGAVGDAVGGATGAVGDAVGGATGAVGDAVGGAAGAVGGAVGDVAGAVGGAVGGDVGGAVGGVGGAVGGAVGGVGGAVGGAVGGVGGAVGGALGGLGGRLGGGLGGLGGSL